MNDLIKAALHRFAKRHGFRKWKAELRSCWLRSDYPGMSPTDASCLQMARNSGVDLDKLTYEELMKPTDPLEARLFAYDGLRTLLDSYWPEEPMADVDARLCAIGALRDNLHDMSPEDAASTYEEIIVELLDLVG